MARLASRARTSKAVQSNKSNNGDWTAGGLSRDLSGYVETRDGSEIASKRASVSKVIRFSFVTCLGVLRAARVTFQAARCFMRCSLLLLVLSALIALPSCGSSVTGSIMQQPPVQAASGFSNASLSGGYAFGSSGTSSAFVQVGSGVVTLDGNGNITAGEETASISGTSCRVLITGTYTVTANGTGTANMNLTPDSPSAAIGCQASAATLSLALANGGASLVLAGEGPNGVSLVTAIKQ